MHAATDPPAAQLSRRHSILQRLTTALPSTSQTVRRFLGGMTRASSSESSSGTNRTAALETTTNTASPEKMKTMIERVSTEKTETQPTADPDAPVALLLPGLSRTLVYRPPAISTSTTVESSPGCRNHPSDQSEPATNTMTTTSVNTTNNTLAAIEPTPLKLPTPKPSKTPNQITTLPLEIQTCIFAQPVLNLTDMMNLRRTCRTWRRNIPIGVLDAKLREQNHAGWQIVFEMNGHKYPGTTYGNRRLCGRCVVPRVRGNLIRGDCVGGYLAGIAEGWGKGTLENEVGNNAEAEGDGEDDESGIAGDWWEWPEDRGMCFPCLWRTLEQAAKDNENLKLSEGEPGTGTATGSLQTPGRGERADALDKTTTTTDKTLVLGGPGVSGAKTISISVTNEKKINGTLKEKSIWRRRSIFKHDKETDTTIEGTTVTGKGPKQGDLEQGKKPELEQTDVPSSAPSKPSESDVVRALKLAAVENKQLFTMMDGTLRKICDRLGCLGDIHENAVPCPRCADFSEWCRGRR